MVVSTLLRLWFLLAALGVDIVVASIVVALIPAAAMILLFFVLALLIKLACTRGVLP